MIQLSKSSQWRLFMDLNVSHLFIHQILLSNIIRDMINNIIDDTIGEIGAAHSNWYQF
jgi:hypothetical protein